ncbi:MAG: thioredoxin domain-containing protein [Bacteroidales bacterium]|nr:thioredoxin domain-containing protein [Bacteroidales bacterium]
MARENISSTLDDFIESWSGVFLLAETNENSIEPNYNENHKRELAIILQKYGLVLAVGLLAGLFFIHNQISQDLGRMLVLFVNCIGLCISYLLVNRQLHIYGKYTDKICSLFKQSDCNNVLESKASKLGGVIGWSEIGLGYFISNGIILLFFPTLFSYLVIINIFTLPYTVWSVWYQKVKVKQWCLLCLIVQMSLWSVFIINLIFFSVQLPTFKVEEILLTGVIYIIPPVTINLLTPQLSRFQKSEQITQEFNALKTNEDIFKVLLKKQAYCEVDKFTSKILFGNIESEILVTVLTNPHCGPCSYMHTRIEKLLQDTNHSICVQYVFSSFNKELESSVRFLIAAYMSYPIEKAKMIYNEWFRGGKYKREDFFEQYDCKQDEQTEREFLQHENWRVSAQLRATPAVFINGYTLPNNYKIEDIKYFTNLDC